MIVININEKRCYKYKNNTYAEKVIDDMFREYFGEMYQKNSLDRRIKEIWEKISINIPKKAIFIEKDSVLYSMTYESALDFKATPDDFFEIDRVTHPVLRNCFENCYSKFKDLIENYKNWDYFQYGEENNLVVNVGFDKERKEFVNVEGILETLERTKNKFYSILKTSLKPIICEQICSQILKVYEEAILQNNPIIIFTETEDPIQKIYAVADTLELKEVTFDLIERDLEEIVYKFIPEDIDFLVNQIYNYIMLPLVEVKPCVRVNKVREEGINATIYLSENNLPVIGDFYLYEMFAFLKVEHNTDTFPMSTRIRYNEKKIKVISIDPEYGLQEFLNFDSSYNDFFKIMEEEGAIAKKEGSYSFWKVYIFD